MILIGRPTLQLDNNFSKMFLFTFEALYNYGSFTLIKLNMFGFLSLPYTQSRCTGEELIRRALEAQRILSNQEMFGLTTLSDSGSRVSIISLDP